MAILIAIIPAVVLVFSVFYRLAGGPYWLGTNLDPSYIYLMNSMYLLDGITPIFVDHPGTTVELLGAAVIKILTFGLSSAERLDRVITDPEFFLHAIHYLFLAFFIASLAAVGWYAYRRTKDVLFALFVQVPSFLYMTVIPDEQPVVVNVNSEALLISCINVFILLLLRWYGSVPKNEIKYAAFIGAAAALAMTTKVTFAPLLLIPLFVIREWKGKGAYLGTFVASWFIITIPIIPRYGKIISWLSDLLFKTGAHGSGQLGFDLGGMISMMRSYAVWNPAVFTVLGGVLIVLGVHFMKRGRLDHPARWVFILWAVCFLQWVMAAKQGSPRYIVPTVGLSGFLVAATYQYCVSRFNWKPVWFTGLLIILLAQTGYLSVRHYVFVRDLNQEIREFSERIYEEYKDCIICGFYRSSSKLTALDFGDDCFGYKKYAGQMQAKYPDAYFYNRWTNSFHTFANWTYIQDIMKFNSCVLLYGGKDAVFPGYIQTEKINENRWEALYRVTGQTAEESVNAYLVSKALEAQKNYKAAYLMGLKAKSLGFPRMDDYLRELEKMLQ